MSVAERVSQSPAAYSGRSSSASRRDRAAWQLIELPTTANVSSAQEYCRRLAAAHYENFTVASRLVPVRLRQHLANVYAFARWSDDLADEVDAAGAPSTLAEWRRGLEACFAGQATHPVYVALQTTIRDTGVTIEPFASLLSAFEEDRAFDEAGVAVRYATRADLLRYCHHSADPVGRIVLALEGCREPHLLRMSDAICTGLQLVNFWQDVRRDRLAGRVYLPAEDLERHGVSESALDAPRASPSVREMVRDAVAWARERFDAGAPLAPVAPPVLRPAIRMFLAGGRATADAIEQCGYDTLRMRPTVGRWRKLRLAWRAWWELQSLAASGCQ